MLALLLTPLRSGLNSAGAWSSDTRPRPSSGVDLSGVSRNNGAVAKKLLKSRLSESTVLLRALPKVRVAEMESVRREEGRQWTTRAKGGVEGHTR